MMTVQALKALLCLTALMTEEKCLLLFIAIISRRYITREKSTHQQQTKQLLMFFGMITFNCGDNCLLIPLKIFKTLLTTAEKCDIIFISKTAAASKPTGVSKSNTPLQTYDVEIKMLVALTESGSQERMFPHCWKCRRTQSISNGPLRAQSKAVSKAG